MSKQVTARQAATTIRPKNETHETPKNKRNKNEKKNKKKRSEKTSTHTVKLRKQPAAAAAVAPSTAMSGGKSDAELETWNKYVRVNDFLGPNKKITDMYIVT